MKKERKSPLTPNKGQLEVLEMISSGKISHLEPSTFRISEFEVVVRKNNKIGYEILTIPECLRGKKYICLLLDYFTTNNYIFDNRSISAQSNLVAKAKHFLAYAKESPDKAPAETPQSYYKSLIRTDTSANISGRLQSLKKMYHFATEEKYKKTSKIPKDVREFQDSLESINFKKPPAKKKPPLGKYLSIPATKFTNRELLFGLRLGSIWILNKIHKIRSSQVEISSIKSLIECIAGLTEAEIKRALPSQLSKNRSNVPEAELSKAYRDQWQKILEDPLLSEWQFYDVKPFSHYSLSYENSPSKGLFSKESQHIFLSRFLDKEKNTIRKAPKGYGKNDEEWKVFKPVFNSSREVARRQAVFWGLDWIRHTSVEKLLFTWLLSSERIQPSGIESLKTTSISVDIDNPKTLQITSMKFRGTKAAQIKAAQVKSPIYRKANPPFSTYLNWLKTNINANEIISDYNPEGYLIVNSSAALHGNFLTDGKTETYTLFRLLITPDTYWNKSFLTENQGNLREAYAFIEILKSRIIPEGCEGALLRLPPDPINQSAVLLKELETNLTEEHSDLNSEVFGHTRETGRRVYKDGFLADNIGEAREILDDFIRHLGDAKYSEALLLSERIKESTKKITLPELKSICNISDSSSSIDKLLKQLSNQERLLLSGIIEEGSEKYVIETDFTAAIMSSYIEHLEQYIPSLSLTDRSTTTINMVAEYIHLTQIFNDFSDEIKTSGTHLKKRLNLKFPPAI